LVKKTCPYCKRDSYSATDEGQWICPYCKKDITDVAASTGYRAADGE